MLNFTKIRPVGVTRYKQSCRDWFANLPSKDFQTDVLNNKNNQNHLTCENSTISVESKENIGCPNTGNICNDQETQGKDKGNLAEDSTIKPLVNITKDNNVSIMKDNKESVVVTHEANYMGEIIDLIESSKEEVLTRKSTRTKKYISVMNQDFLW